MKQVWREVGVGILGVLAALGVTALTSFGSLWINIGFAIVVGCGAGIVVWWSTRDTKGRREQSSDSKPDADSKNLKFGPIQIFLPQWDGSNEGDFYQDGVIQKRGFDQGRSEASGIYAGLDVDFQATYENSSGRDLLRAMKDLYKDRNSVYFVMTMSTNVEEVREGFIAWRKECVETGKVPPVLIVTVASAPGLSDFKNGIVRWYICSEEECQFLGNHLDTLRVKNAAAFCITKHPGVSDDRYGTEGLKQFRKYFGGSVDVVSFVTAKTAKAHVQDCLSKWPQKDRMGVFIIGYGDMVKNTLITLIDGGYSGYVACTSTLTDRQWQPPSQILAGAKAKIFTVIPRPYDENDDLAGDNGNVVFLFTRKTLLRVIKLTAGNVSPETFIERWMNGDEEEPQKLAQVYDWNRGGDTVVFLKVVEMRNL